MTLAVVYSRASSGIHAPSVIIEVHLSKGLPGLNIVGLPEKEVKESKDRVRSALLNSQFEFPAKRITVNLAPADLPKEGGRFDLPIALGILAASEQISAEVLKEFEIAGELALSGELRAIQGVLPFAMATRADKRKLLLPAANANEATLNEGLEVYPAKHLLEVTAHLAGQNLITPYCASGEASNQIAYPDLADVKGQLHGKRALEIAAAGGHSLLLSGPPGTGKTMLATRLPGILPPMAEEQALETAAIYSISLRGFDREKQWRVRPYRAPHHTASSVALVGGGSPPRPGEISLAHGGVLFLDELPEFNRHVLEALREPLEAGTVTISRAAHQAQYPACFQLIAAMNPCPCGYYGDKSGRCRCTREQVQRYQSRLSGPLYDRIDMYVEMSVLPGSVLLNNETKSSETSKIVRERVTHARDKALARANKPNALLPIEEVKTHCALTTKDQVFLQNAMEKLSLSARALHRVLKLARTIADLDGSNNIASTHLQEALSYRRVERNR